MSDRESRRERRRKPRPINIDEHPTGKRTDLRIPVYQDSLANPITAPFVVVRGMHPGPVVGISAAVHGDELNGIKIIHNVLNQADPEHLHGALLCAPVANVPAFNAGQRHFPEDGKDLNHVFPGKPDGTPSSQYAKAFLTTFLPACDFLIDIHTASEGRINSLYVRADLHSPEAREMAMLMNPEIVLHGRSGDGTLRNAARLRGIPAITVEAGNPSTFQGRMVLEGEVGLLNVLTALGVLRAALVGLVERRPVICGSSKWLRTREGGLLHTRFGLCDRVHKKQVMADLTDPFGYEVASYTAPSDGVVIGMSKSPLAVPGTRYCHLGAIGEPPPLSKKEQEREQERDRERARSGSARLNVTPSDGHATVAPKP
jgi:uncharacterized protein